MHKLSRARISLAIGLLAAFWLVVAAPPLASSQAESEAFQGQAGPYHLVVDVLPARPVVGDLQFHVRPTLTATGATASDPRVWVILGRRGIQEVKTPALRSPEDPTTFVGNAKVNRAGTWEVFVEVTSAEGSGEASFSIEVASRGRSGEGLVAPTMAYAGAAVVIVAGIGWLVLQSRRARRRLPPGS